MSRNELRLHTPGPWNVNHDTLQAGYPVWAQRKKRSGGGPAICTVIPPRRTSEAFSESRANAHLIAAAPDLLDALKALLERADEDTIARAQAAIEKAVNL